MKNNKKTILLILLTITTLILLSTASATTDNTTSTTTSSIKEKTTTTEPVVKEKIEKSTTKEITTKEHKIIKNNKTQDNIKKDPVTIDGVTYTNIIENQIINEYTVAEGNTYINNSTFNVEGDDGLDLSTNSFINNSVFNAVLYCTQGKVKIINSQLNSGLGSWGTEFYIDDSNTIGENFHISEVYNTFNEVGGKIYTNNTDLIQKLQEKGIEYYDFPYDGTNEIKNKNINKDITILTTGNITLINCQINAKITNNGNLTLQNCSLSNNNMTTSGSKTDGFLLENKGNVTLIDCRVENNTFNVTRNTGNYIYPSGVIVNYNDAVLSLNNTVFKNNTNLGSDNSLIYNLGTINYFNNCTFINNNIKSYVSKGYGTFQNPINPDESILIVTNSLFENNTYNVFEAINMTIKDSVFKNNKYIFLESGTPGGGEEPSGIAISATNLNVDNCTFDGNGIISKHEYAFYGGYGGAISASNLIVNNSRFTNNVANTTTTWNPTSGTGAAISVGNGEIYNTIFENNTVSNPSTRTIPTIGKEEYGMSTEGGLPGSGADIYSTGTIKIINNTFINSHASGVASSIYSYVYTITHKQNNITIRDNTFQNCKSGLDTIVIEKNDVNPAKSEINVENNIYTNTTINDKLTLNVPSKIFTGEPITITGTYNILNTSFYDPNILEQNKFTVYINDELVDTIDTIEFTITPTSGTMHITVQPTISQTEKTLSIRATTLTNITITPENYNEHVYKGALDVSPNSKVIFQGTFTDKDLAIPINDIILDGSTATFTNTTFTLEATGIIFKNMNIENQETTYPISNTGDNNIITNNKITITNTNGKTAGIYNKANNTEISYNTIIVDGPAMTIDYSGGLGVANTQAILLLGGNNNLVQYNTIQATSTGSTSIYGTIEGITNNINSTNTNITNNNITVTGNAKFNYAINNLGNVQNITIQYNNILVTGERYADGIQVGNGAENIIIDNNNIKCVCLNTTPVDEEAITYGIVTTNMGNGISNNINITNNNIDLTGSVNYGIEVYQTTNTVLDNNVINTKGPQSMGIGYAHSQNSTITNNIITTEGNSTIPLTQVTEEIQPANVGIKIQQESDNILIQDNTIQTYDVGKKDATINIETSNVTVKDNNLTSTTKTGDNTITTTQHDTIIDNNNAIEQESTTQTATETLTTGESTTLTAQFYDDTYTPAGDGKAIFRVNGKTLRDNQGNVIYADVINGRAELPDVNITQEWTKEGTTIQAVYVGDDNNEPITTTPTTVTVTKPEATIILDAPTEATAGTTITLKATVTDGDNAISSGRVAFKLNGKTLKDPKTGKALYAEVRDGVATIQYTIPAKTKAKEYTLTVVFTDTKYDRVEAESKLNVVKA